MLDQLNISWDNIFKYYKTEYNTHDVNICNSSDNVIISTFEVEFKNAIGSCVLIYKLNNLKHILNKSNILTNNDKKIYEKIEDLPINIIAQYDINMTLDDIINLKVNDVFIFNKNNPLNLLIDSTIKYKGILKNNDNLYREVKITKNINKKQEQLINKQHYYSQYDNKCYITNNVLFDFISKDSLFYIKNEHPQTLACILYFLNADIAAYILENLSEGIRAEIIMRMYNLNVKNYNILYKLNNFLHKHLKIENKISENKMNLLDTISQLNTILMLLSCETKSKILMEIKEDNDNLYKRMIK